MQKLIKIDVSPIFDIFPFGAAMYKAEYFLLKYKCLNRIWISTTPRPEKTRIIDFINNNFQSVICASYRVGRELAAIKIVKIAGFKPPANLRFLSLSRLHDVVWSLILSDYVTHDLNTSMDHFISNSIPVFPEKK